jgi:hypothetical protein
MTAMIVSNTPPTAPLALVCALGAAACFPIEVDPDESATGAAYGTTAETSLPGSGGGSTTGDGAFTSTGLVEGSTTADATFTSTGFVEDATTGLVEDPSTGSEYTGTTGAPVRGECSPEALGEFGPDDYKAAADKLDFDALEPLQCPWNNEAACVDAPIAGSQTALVVRNDMLTTPREFVVPNARWLVLSNLELGCGDPFSAPLCAGDWRISFPIGIGEWCEGILDEGSFGYYIDHGMPLLLEFGDAECHTHTGTPQDADNQMVGLLFPPGMGGPEGTLPGQLCSLCQIPGVDAPIAGNFVAEICE